MQIILTSIHIRINNIVSEKIVKIYSFVSYTELINLANSDTTGLSMLSFRVAK